VVGNNGGLPSSKYHSQLLKLSPTVLHQIEHARIYCLAQWLATTTGCLTPSIVCNYQNSHQRFCMKSIHAFIALPSGWQQPRVALCQTLQWPIPKNTESNTAPSVMRVG